MKIVLAYSGGLDTSVAIVWLKEKYDAEIVGFCSDVGQGEDLEAARKKALRTGAVSCHVLDQRDEFVRDFVFPAGARGGGLRGDVFPGHGAGAPVHRARHDGGRGARGGHRDLPRIDRQGERSGALRAGGLLVQPVVRIIAPWREWDFKSRSELLAFAEARKIPVEATASKPYSIDRNLLHTSYEGGILEDPDAEPPAEMFQRTADPRRAPDEAREVSIGFEKGSRWPSTARRWGRRRCSPSSTPSPAPTASAAPTSSRTASSA
jgi:argininosuccinate synthase